jgi:hypothetical protein
LICRDKMRKRNRRSRLATRFCSQHVVFNRWSRLNSDIEDLNDPH